MCTGHFSLLWGSFCAFFFYIISSLKSSLTNKKQDRRPQVKDFNKTWLRAGGGVFKNKDILSSSNLSLSTADELLGGVEALLKTLKTLKGGKIKNLNKALNGIKHVCSTGAQKA